MTRSWSPMRIQISMRRLLEHRLIDLFDYVRLKRAGVAPKQAEKAARKARCRRFYNRVIGPEMKALIRDMERRGL